MKKVIFFISIIILGWSCLKIEEASEIPEISLKEYEYVQGIEPELEQKAFIITMSLSFIDGDGDIGSTDTTENQLFITPLKKKNKEISDTLDTLFFHIPYIEPVKTVRTMNGEIECTFFIQEIGNYHINDTFIFELFIKDRAENISNVVSTIPEDFVFKYNDE